MADISALFNQTIPAYQKPEDLDFPVSKIRLFIDVLWQAVTGKTLTDEQKTTLKQLIDLLNLLDEHKHETEKELISAMLPSISPLLQKMPTLGLTGTHVFAHLVPMYQLYLPTIEQMVKDAHPFSQEETLLYYQTTIFDHLFLVHIFEQEPNANMIEMLLTIKALILTNALVYDYHQHVAGRSISFFTFLMRGGLSDEQLLPFLEKAVNRVKEEAKQTVTNTACLDSLEFLTTKLMDTTKTPTTDAKTNEEKETNALDAVMQANTPPDQVTAVFNQATETPVEKPLEPVAPPTETPTPQPATAPESPIIAPEPVIPTMPPAEPPMVEPPAAEPPAESVAPSAPSPAVEAAIAENVSTPITPDVAAAPTEPVVPTVEPMPATPIETSPAAASTPSIAEAVMSSPTTPEPPVVVPSESPASGATTVPEPAPVPDPNALLESPILATPSTAQTPTPVT